MREREISATPKVHLDMKHLIIKLSIQLDLQTEARLFALYDQIVQKALQTYSVHPVIATGAAIYYPNAK